MAGGRLSDVGKRWQRREGGQAGSCQGKTDDQRGTIRTCRQRRIASMVLPIKTNRKKQRRSESMKFRCVRFTHVRLRLIGQQEFCDSKSDTWGTREAETEGIFNNAARTLTPAPSLLPSRCCGNASAVR
jgi:hypothetical protein